jgi:hypothetical protein
MKKFFISYRKDDAPSAAFMIDERIGMRFGKERTFLDYHAIPAGEDFRPWLWGALDQSIALIAVIGSRWLGIADDHTPLISREEDFVRREVAEALRKSIPVVPVLVEGGTLPSASLLPEDVRPIVHRQYVTLNRRTLGRDLEYLMDRLAALDGSLDDAAKDVEPAGAATTPAGIGSISRNRIGNVLNGTGPIHGPVFGGGLRGDYVTGDKIGRDKNVHMQSSGDELG